MQLVIAEKPSVAASIAKVIGAYKREDGYLEGSGYLVSWCIGHLVELAAPQEYDECYQKWRIEDLPIVPQTWKYKVSDGTKKQFYILKKLMQRSDVDELVAATDAGREGELIFRLVYKQAECNKPFKRLWISSMEDSAIRDGFANLRDGHDYDNLYSAALARSWADWLVGMNGTRLFTKLYDRKLTVGRVQTPTLAMITERQNQINAFEKQKYFNVHLDLDGLRVTKEKIFEPDEAEALLQNCQGKRAVITFADKKEKTSAPPRLYDLTTLQREANRYYGYTAQNTLNYTQSLYEKKLVTYPRTDSQFLTDDMSDTAMRMTLAAADILEIKRDEGFDPDIKRVLDSRKVSDHHAIIPTDEVHKTDLTALGKGELDILLLICMKLLAATGRLQTFAETEIHAECEGTEFSVKGKSVINPGWKVYEDAFREKINAKKSEEEKDIPLLTKGQVFEKVKASKTEHFTSPPKAFSEDSLLSAMETAGNEDFDDDTEKKGLGTPATRAEIIEKLVRNNYVKRKGKQLIPTEEGMALTQILPEDVKSPKLTADWENALKLIEKGEMNADSFMAEITDMIRELVAKNGIKPEGENPFGDGEKLQHSKLGKCPRCGHSVYEGKKSFYCSDRECGFTIWKESKWLTAMKKSITTEMVESLLSNGSVHVSGLYSQRTGKSFDADLLMEDDGTHVNFRLDFGKKNTAKEIKKG